MADPGNVFALDDVRSLAGLEVRPVVATREDVLAAIDRHCRADLRDPQYRDMGVADIARRWGFPSPAHFSRAYRAAFGVSPSSDRRRDDDA